MPIPNVTKNEDGSFRLPCANPPGCCPDVSLPDAEGNFTISEFGQSVKLTAQQIDALFAIKNEYAK